jgi:hypothetical protein
MVVCLRYMWFDTGTMKAYAYLTYGQQHTGKKKTNRQEM